MIKLIVGLGNPEDEYKKTRHNAGFWAVDVIANKYKTHFNKSAKFFGEVAAIKANASSDIFLLKPQTYMNLSGKAVLAMASFYKIPPEQILVIHDELDFEVGVVKLKQGGGNGGHNGLKDIDRVIGRNYWRLRIGIDHPGDKNKVVSYVLKAPSMDDRISIDNAIDRAVGVLDKLVKGEYNDAMKLLHTTS
jgi:PTH1 family peptidyl-tRNA hydrolase